MTTTPNPPASIESLRNDLALIDCDASHTTAKVQAAKRRVSAALSELEGLRAERLHWLAKSAEEVSALRADLAAALKAKEEAEKAADERHGRLVVLADDYRVMVARADALGARVGALKQVADEMLYQFSEPTHPGIECRRSGHIRLSTITAWRGFIESTPTADLSARDAKVREPLEKRIEELEEKLHTTATCALRYHRALDTISELVWEHQQDLVDAAFLAVNTASEALDVPPPEPSAHDARVRREALLAIHPRNWSRPMSEAWHRNIPNVDAAFSAVIAIMAPEPPAPRAGEEVQDAN